VRLRSVDVACALGIDALVGDPSDRFHPVAWFGRLAAGVEQAAWRDARSRGAAVAASLVALAIEVGALLDELPGGGVLAAWAALGSRTLWRRALEVADALEEADVERARDQLEWLVGRERVGLGASEIARAAIESVAENTADAILGVIVWHVAFGAAGSLAVRAANTLDAMFGHRSVRYLRFGWASARLDDLLIWPAVRLAVLLAPRRERRLLRAAREHPSPNAGVMEALAAAAVGVRLGGENRYGDRVVRLPVLEGGHAPGATEIRTAVRWSRGVTIRALSFVGAVELMAWLIERRRGGIRGPLARLADRPRPCKTAHQRP